MISLSVFVVNSCRYDNEEDMIDCSTINPDTISYARDIQPIFDANCNESGCHSGAHPEGGLNLEAAYSYNELMDEGSGYVDTIRPRRSLLYSEMSSKSDPMPPTGKLDKCTLEKIERWMQQKAKNN